jgi:hypothetical protein
MIKKATQLDFTDKKLKVLIAGYPGIGKTTRALSAPKPLLLDLDNGIDRVEAKYRSDTSVVQNYDELLSDLESADLSEYETIVVDTGGKLLELMKPKVISEDIKNGQRDGNLTLKGYGAVSRLFQQFVHHLEKLNKHLVFVFHAKEDKDGDEVRLRIQVEGSTKDSIWQGMDLGGFVEMRGKNDGGRISLQLVRGAHQLDAPAHQGFGTEPQPAAVQKGLAEHHKTLARPGLALG